MIVVYGGTSSGKSEIAENIACSLALGTGKELFYMATMENQSEAAKKRIAHHKSLREGKGFKTIEEMYDPSSWKDTLKGAVVLLECTSNLFANVLFREAGENVISEEKLKKLVFNTLDNILTLDEETELVVVTNNVFGAGKSSDLWCDSYMKGLGLLNELLAKEAVSFLEVNFGQITYLKGENYWQ